MPAKTQSKNEETETKQSALEANTASKAKDGTPLDKEGFALNSAGERDKRYQLPYEADRPNGKAGDGKSRAEKMQEILDPKTHSWEYVDEGFDADGTTSATGAKVKNFHRIKDTKTGDVIKVGKGEMEKYAGVKAPSKRAAAKDAEDKNDEAFAGEEGASDEELDEILD